MIGLIQRVSEASVTVDNQVVGQINTGLLALIGIEKLDNLDSASRLLEKLLAYRVFADEQDKMNLSLEQVNGGLLLVPQFTLVAQTNKGLRPSFTAAANPQLAQKLFTSLGEMAAKRYPSTQFGQFGADMKVRLLNDGPVTFWLQIEPRKME